MEKSNGSQLKKKKSNYTKHAEQWAEFIQNS